MLQALGKQMKRFGTESKNHLNNQDNLNLIDFVFCITLPDFQVWSVNIQVTSSLSSDWQ